MAMTPQTTRCVTALLFLSFASTLLVVVQCGCRATDMVVQGTVCEVSGEPGWPTLSPARLAATLGDAVEDVVADFFQQFPELDEEGTALIVLHSSVRIPLLRLRGMQATLKRTGKFVDVLVIPPDEELKLNGVSPESGLFSLIGNLEDMPTTTSIIVFTDNVAVVHLIRVARLSFPSLIPSMYEGYLFGAPNIASGLRLFAALQPHKRISTPMTWGTHYPGGIDWFKAKRLIEEAEGIALDKKNKNRTRRVITAKAVTQAVLTSTYIPMEELTNGIMNVLRLIQIHVEKSTEGVESTDWVLLFDDTPHKSNCWIAKIVNKLVNDSMGRIKKPKFVSSKNAHIMFEPTVWGGSLPNRVIVVVMDDNSCSGNQMKVFFESTFSNIFKGRELPDSIEIVQAPILSTNAAQENVLRTIESKLSTWFNKLEKKEPKFEYAELQVDSVKSFGMKKTLRKKKGRRSFAIEVHVVQYLELGSILSKVFKGEKRAQKAITTSELFQDPRGNYHIQNAFLTLYKGKVGKVGHEKVTEVYGVRKVLDGKISTVFDWKVVDALSMPEDFTFGLRNGLLFAHLMKIYRDDDDSKLDLRSSDRFFQPSCPPYKYEDLRATALCVECDSFKENRYAESLLFGPYANRLDVNEYASFDTSGAYRGQKTRVEVQAFMKKSNVINSKTSLCQRMKRVDCKPSEWTSPVWPREDPNDAEESNSSSPLASL